MQKVRKLLAGALLSSGIVYGALSVMPAVAWADSYQYGDNDSNTDQNATANSGDGNAGQSIGGVSSGNGDVNINASNHTEDSTVETGDATATNSSNSTVGHHYDADDELVDVDDLDPDVDPDVDGADEEEGEPEDGADAPLDPPAPGGHFDIPVPDFLDSLFPDFCVTIPLLGEVCL